MGLVAAALTDVAVVAFVSFVVLSQPRPVWRDAAEHSRGFWLGWAAASVAVGFAPLATGALSEWGAVAWLTACCGFAVLQPALWADVLDVRRDVARRRAALLEKRAQETARGE